MRLWLRDSERRPDPAPVQTDDRLPIIAGTVVFAIVLVAALVLPLDFTSAARAFWCWTCAAGVLLGLLALIYTQRRRRK